jgi:predicted transcriptional regulator
MKVSEAKKERISEQILALLYSQSPQALFTSEIAQELARDEEFIRTLLLTLKSKKLTVQINKNPKGVPYIRRARWRMSDEAYKFYKSQQTP